MAGRVRTYLFGPTGVAVDAAGNVYVADRGNDRVQVFDENGRFLLEWPNLHAIDAVHTAGDHVYAGLGTDNRILKLDRNGAVLDSWGSEQELGFPHGVCCARAGNLYVAEILANRATKLRIESDAPVEESLALSTKSRPA
ncbi:hypothetical protein B4Q13_25500 [Lacticaseibacillus rhamnosus]